MILRVQARPVANSEQRLPETSGVTQYEPVPSFVIFWHGSVMFTDQDVIGQRSQERRFRLEVPVEGGLLNIEVGGQSSGGEPVQPGLIQDRARTLKYGPLI